MAWSDGNGGTCSWSFFNSAIISLGMRSGRVLITWPNLMNVGPSASSDIRTRATVVTGGRGGAGLRENQRRQFCQKRGSPSRVTTSPKP
jgi:hypothetical protein